MNLINLHVFLKDDFVIISLYQGLSIHYKQWQLRKITWFSFNIAFYLKKNKTTLHAFDWVNFNLFKMLLKLDPDVLDKKSILNGKYTQIL